MDDAAGPYAPAGAQACCVLPSTPIRADMRWQAVGRQSMPVVFEPRRWVGNHLSGNGRARRNSLYMLAGCLC